MVESLKQYQLLVYQSLVKMLMVKMLMVKIYPKDYSYCKISFLFIEQFEHFYDPTVLFFFRVYQIQFLFTGSKLFSGFHTWESPSEIFLDMKALRKQF